MPVIDVVNLSKSFGKKVVLDGVNLSVEEGESLVVLGGSGSGKTVLLRCILGLFRPDAGHVSLEGKIVQDLRPKPALVCHIPNVAFVLSGPFDQVLSEAKAAVKEGR